MSAHHFTLIVDGADLQDESVVNSFFESGCDDALVGSTDEVQFIDFDREAASWDEAVLSAVADVEQVDGVRVIRVNEDGSALARSKDMTRKEREREERKQLLEEILLILNRHKVRATYSAVACILKMPPQSLGRKWLGCPRPWASWIVRKGNGEPTGYDKSEKHPDLRRAEWMKSCCELRKWLKRPERPLPISKHANGCDGGC